MLTIFSYFLLNPYKKLLKTITYDHLYTSIKYSDNCFRMRNKYLTLLVKEIRMSLHFMSSCTHLTGAKRGSFFSQV